MLPPLVIHPWPLQVRKRRDRTVLPAIASQKNTLPLDLCWQVLPGLGALGRVHPARAVGWLPLLCDKPFVLPHVVLQSRREGGV